VGGFIAPERKRRDTRWHEALRGLPRSPRAWRVRFRVRAKNHHRTQLVPFALDLSLDLLPVRQTSWLRPAA
jgi:hypothetical protein